MKRRHFLKSTFATAGAFSMGAFPYEMLAGTEKKYANDEVMLGNTGIKLSRLAMGTGTHGVNRSSNQTRKLGIQGLGELLHAAYDEGVNFWDSADQYGTHPHLKEGLKYVPREKVVIMTKTHATTEKEMWADIDRFRKEIGTDYLDIMLLHCMMDGNWPKVKQGAMNVLAEAKEKGIIRTHGVSCHTLSALKSAADSDWVEVDLVRINPDGVMMDSDVPTVLGVMEKMKNQGKGLIGMKIFGAGRLDTKLDQCLQYALNKEMIDCFTIGQESQAQMKDLLKRIPAASTRG